MRLRRASGRQTHPRVGVMRPPPTTIKESRSMHDLAVCAPAGTASHTGIPLQVVGSAALVRAEEVGRRVGVEATEVEQLPFDLSGLLDDGVFVNVDAQGFGLLDRRLDW